MSTPVRSLLFSGYLGVAGVVEEDEDEPPGGVVVVVLLLPSGDVVVVVLPGGVAAEPPALPVAPPVVPLVPPGGVLALGAPPALPPAAPLSGAVVVPAVPLAEPEVLPAVPELGALLVAPLGASVDSFFPHAVTARAATNAASNTEYFMLVPLKKYSCRLSTRLIGETTKA